ncbi:nucleotidyl transferase AbiEii/AbiGii toxin family protein [Psychrobacter glacincola]
MAISRDKFLSQNLVIKGGIVLSLAYGSERYTTDLIYLL